MSILLSVMVAILLACNVAWYVINYNLWKKNNMLLAQIAAKDKQLADLSAEAEQVIGQKNKKAFILAVVILIIIAIPIIRIILKWRKKKKVMAVVEK